MWRRVFCTLTVGVSLTSLAAAQSILTDQFQMNEPGLTATNFQDLTNKECTNSTSDPRSAGPFYCQTDWTSDGAPARVGHGTDALGRMYQIRPRIGFIDGQNRLVYDIQRLNGGTNVFAVVTVPGERTICNSTGQLCDSRCGQGESVFQYTYLYNLAVDPVNGYLDLAVASKLTCGAGGFSFIEERGIIRVSGLPTLLDIFLSYQPPATLTWNVPRMPEGLGGSDSFSLYAGDAHTVSDLSQSIPVQCVVPSARPPVPGEQLTVNDPLPAPASGDARYYLAAVNYQGQRRAGQQSSGGTPQGRNAAALPACQ